MSVISERPTVGRSPAINRKAQMQRSPLRLIVAALAALTVALAVAAPSDAARPASVSGSVAPTSANFYPTPLPDGNVLVGFTGTHAWTGSFTGTSTIEGQLLQTPTGQITYLAFVTFTGSTPCGYGTVSFISTGSGPLPGPVAGRTVTIDHTGSVRIHASLQTSLFLGPQGASVTFTGNAHCD
jgi:hypothetical protein